GLSSGAFGGSKLMLAGTSSSADVCQPAWSSRTTAFAPGDTPCESSSSCTAIVVLLHHGSTSAGSRSAASRSQAVTPSLPPPPTLSANHVTPPRRYQFRGVDTTPRLLRGPTDGDREGGASVVYAQLIALAGTAARPCTSMAWLVPAEPKVI